MLALLMYLMVKTGDESEVESLLSLTNGRGNLSTKCSPSVPNGKPETLFLVVIYAAAWYFS